ncbi:hypothetical protein MKW98_003672 [Papaver atlanticum]|uniref:Uncharacterized protein n=1 Tax=Papaver atlanticum TaxID=357466 RepID=A0AAD4SIT7_9MAGN|nr:hypothetical protein MKW98_003672 [Papaver atlanticum]
MRIRNIDAWTFVCTFFNSDEFKAASKKGRATQKAQALYHTNGTQSFARKAYEMLLLWDVLSEVHPPVD